MRNRAYDLPPLDQLEAFEAAARHLSFTKAADELALTQSAVSRQVAALEAFFGVPLFQRLHRALRLSDAGLALQRTVTEVLRQLHQTTTALRGERRLKTVVVSTTAGFAGLWLIPRLAGFTAAHPDVDVRISASYALVNLQRDGVDVAVRYSPASSAGDGERLFGDTLTPVCSPRLLRDRARPLKVPADLRHHCLLRGEGSDGQPLVDWDLWLRAMKLESLEPASALHLSQYDQIIQAAVAGQGVALGRFPLVQELVRQRRLAVPFKDALSSQHSYVLMQSDAARSKPEVQDFLAWIRAEAARGADATAPARGSAGPSGRARP